MALPIECWEKVFEFLEIGDRLHCSLVCKAWFDRLKSFYAYVIGWCLLFVEDGCSLDVRFERIDAELYQGVVRLCNCPKHVADVLQFSRTIFRVAGHRARRLSIEDELTKSGGSIDGRVLQTLLQNCVRINRLDLCNVSVSGMVGEQLRSVSSLEELNSLFVEECYANSWINDAVLKEVALLQWITEICLRYCEAVTDTSLQCLGEQCPYLNNVDLSGCKGVTSAGVACFLTSLQKKIYDLLHVKVTKSSVDGDHLRKLFQRQSDDWIFTSFENALGRPACCIYRRSLPHKSVIMYV